jgi:hypothetical protein
LDSGRLRPYWIGLLILWAVTIALPVATIRSCDSVVRNTGVDILAAGWLGPLIGQFAWLANPLLLLLGAFAFSGKLDGSGRGKIFGAVLCLLVVNALFWSRWSVEGCDHVQITDYHMGYWLWIATVATSGGLAIWQDYAANLYFARKEEI